MKKQFFSLAIVLSSVLSLAQAQLVKKEMLVIASETLNKSAKSTPSSLYIGKDMLMVKTGTEANKGHMALFNADKEILYIVDHDKKEISTISRKDIEKIIEELDGASAEMKKQLANLPPEQRAVMEKQMGALIKGSDMARFSAAEQGKVSGWDCQMYVSQESDKKEAEICFATYQAMGYEADDFEVMAKLFEFLDPAVGTISRMFPSYANLFNTNVLDFAKGLPVRSVKYDTNGQPESTTTLKSIEEVELEENRFELPKNYKRQNIAGKVK